MGRAIPRVARNSVYIKYGGRCGYTGKPLDATWQVDHKIPKSHPIWWQADEAKARRGINYSCNDIENLMPALSIVNHYKRALDVEEFRKYLMQFHKRLSKLPKKTRIFRTEKRKEYMRRVAEAFDIEVDKPFSGVFYFETI